MRGARKYAAGGVFDENEGRFLHPSDARSAAGTARLAGPPMRPARRGSLPLPATGENPMAHARRGEFRVSDRYRSATIAGIDSGWTRARRCPPPD